MQKYEDDHFDHLESDSKLYITCNDCGKLFGTSKVYWRQHKNDANKVWRCKECLSKHKSEFNKTRWKNLSDDERKGISDKQSSTQTAYWARTVDDDRMKRLSNFIGAGTNHLKNLPKEDREKINNALRERFINMSDTERAEHITKSIQWYHNLSDDEKRIWAKRAADRWNTLDDSEKERRSNLLIENHKKWVESLSDKERYEYYQKNGSYLKKFWENISDDDKLNWFYLTNKSITESDHVLNMMTETEAEFSNILNKYSINYKFQYMNESYDPDFYKKFDKSKSPYHKWDFILMLNTENILVDIDGSEHFIPIGSVITKDGLDIGKIVKDNDSKRPYQTGGLNAYIIQLKNNKFDDSANVINVHSEETMTLNQFIAFMNVCNSKKSDLDGAIKEVLDEKVRR